MFFNFIIELFPCSTPMRDLSDWSLFFYQSSIMRIGREKFLEYNWYLIYLLFIILGVYSWKRKTLLSKFNFVLIVLIPFLWILPSEVSEGHLIIRMFLFYITLRRSLSILLLELFKKIKLRERKIYIFILRFFFWKKDFFFKISLFSIFFLRIIFSPVLVRIPGMGWDSHFLLFLKTDELFNMIKKEIRGYPRRRRKCSDFCGKFNSTLLRKCVDLKFLFRQRRDYEILGMNWRGEILLKVKGTYGWMSLDCQIHGLEREISEEFPRFLCKELEKNKRFKLYFDEFTHEAPGSKWVIPFQPGHQNLAGGEVTLWVTPSDRYSNTGQYMGHNVHAELSYHGDVFYWTLEVFKENRYANRTEFLKRVVEFSKTHL